MQCLGYPLFLIRCFTHLSTFIYSHHTLHTHTNDYISSRHLHTLIHDHNHILSVVRDTCDSSQSGTARSHTSVECPSHLPLFVSRNLTFNTFDCLLRFSKCLITSFSFFSQPFSAVLFSSLLFLFPSFFQSCSST